ncbi:hypothetical protein C1H46_005128 [Malus baccata]|uniref:Uncharacterized protein n=1 Tax=Malus baccata TaxID=106549 RepID=A0A540NEZ6_MALBA|nr:hypothetical protein C1H46_005128 [Malus baccata]
MEQASKATSSPTMNSSTSSSPTMTSSTGSPPSSPSLLRALKLLILALPPHQLGHLRHDCFVISV